MLQEFYDSIDVHVGQSVTVLVTLNQPAGAYYIAASSRFSPAAVTATAVLRYAGSSSPVSGQIPSPFPIENSIIQARSFRWNLTANAARPNPQGSYHYGTVPVARSLVLSSSSGPANGRLRYAVNGLTYVNPDTPLKLADYFNIGGVFTVDNIQTGRGGPPVFATSVLRFNLHDFVEIVFQNTESEVQSWHVSGYDFWVVA